MPTPLNSSDDTTGRQSLTSEELYSACRGLDLTAQERAYRILWDYLLRVVLIMVRDQPDAEDLAQDCAQRALIRVHSSIEACREPAAFRVWARQIATRLAIDELRRRRRLAPPLEGDADVGNLAVEDSSLPGAVVGEVVGVEEWRRLLQQAPISERSRRVVVGRYLDDVADEQLAQAESGLSGQAVLPSHIQVTRAKNIAKLRQWTALRAFIEAGMP